MHRRPPPRSVWRLALVTLVGVSLFAAPLSAQELPTAVTRRAVRAAVKITCGQSTGSGSIIDARGYVLTNFHVVGNTTPGHGAPGTLYVPQNEVRIAMADNARASAQTRYTGRVVRADVRLDLALIRITADIHGAPIPRSHRFPTVQLSTTSHLRPGSRVFAFGFPLNVQTINVTSGEMSGFQMNSRDEVAWIRTDAEFNPGNSGGMLLDRRGRLVAVPTAVVGGRRTLEPIEVARPVERIPRSWHRDLRRGHIEDTVIDGVPELPMGEYTDEAVGDGGALGGGEWHFFRVPAQRPLRIDVSPALGVDVVSPEGRTLSRGRGHVDLTSRHGQDVVLAIAIPPRRETGGGTLAIRIRTHVLPTGPAGWGDMPPPGGRTAAPVGTRP